MKKIISLLLIICITTGLSTPVLAVIEPTISKTSVTIAVGEALTLKTSGLNSKIKWKSSDANIATVSSTGKVVGKSVGKAKISASFDEGILFCEVTVKKYRLHANLSKTEIGEEVKIAIKGKTSDKNIRWFFDDEKASNFNNKKEISWTPQIAGKHKVTVAIDGKKYSKYITVMDTKTDNKATTTPSTTTTAPSTSSSSSPSPSRQEHYVTHYGPRGGAICWCGKYMSSH